MTGSNTKPAVKDLDSSGFKLLFPPFWRLNCILQSRSCLPPGCTTPPGQSAGSSYVAPVFVTEFGPLTSQSVGALKPVL
ncbi:Uncharacterised protein [Acinetobacter baumannii]|nr:Uncharacterised protein [Acinetobacter baumannii]